MDRWTESERDRMPEAYRNNLEHLDDELAWLDLNLRLGVARARSQRQDGAGLYVSDRLVDEALDEAARAPEATEYEAGWIGLIDRKREAIVARVSASLEEGVPLRLPRLCTLFVLSPFESDVLMLCLAPQLDLKYEQLYAYLQDDATRRAPSADLVLNLLCRSTDERAVARAAFVASGCLFRYSLLQFADPAESSRPLLSRSLRLDEGIAHTILGMKDVDPRIATCTRLIPPSGEPRTSQVSLPLLESFLRYVERPPSAQWIALFHGPDRARQEETVRQLCSKAGIPLLRVDLETLADADSSFGQSMFLLFRDAALKSAAVYAEPVDVFSREPEKGAWRLRCLEKAMEELGWVTFLGGRNPLELSSPLKRQMFFEWEFPLPTYTERKLIWREIMGNGQSHEDDPSLAALAARFRFTRREIGNALGMARTRALLREGDNGAVTLADIEAACRAESHSRLVSFARKMESAYGWEDLVLPKPHKEQLQEIIDYIHHHAAVYTEWGFGRKHSLGKGVNILFSGPSGTGKTMAAGIVAAKLGLDCYKIDLSTVVSKYIGETEKNLNRIFSEAETSNAILFFDEADALFGKRTEVKDSHDRYANIEVNYLLQKMEEHEGVVILATNLSKNVDEAFLRRVQFSVVFPCPELEERLLVWQRVFPAEAPMGEDIDWEFLARRFKIVGGNIKNIAVGAAFLARRESSAVGMRHIVISAKREFQKIGKLCTKAEFGDYHELVA
jgi:SpoVK/Ycf46/Vps4 family AAA+-type ATPase